MLKKILTELERIADALWQVLAQLSTMEENQRVLLYRLEQKEWGSAQEAEESIGTDKWLQDGIASILGYQPGRKKGEE